VLAVCCVRCGPSAAVCGGGGPCGGKHAIITLQKGVLALETGYFSREEVLWY